MAQEGVSRFEKMPTRIYPDVASASRAVAEEIAQLIKQRQAEGRKVRCAQLAQLASHQRRQHCSLCCSWPYCLMRPGHAVHAASQASNG
jgi:hypothetical protein